MFGKIFFIISGFALAGSVLLVLLKKMKPKLWLIILILVSSLVIYSTQIVYYWDFEVDDAYISLRYSKNLAETGELRFNLSDERPIEGYSNFLWVVLTSVFFHFNINHIIALKVLGMILALASLGLVFWILKDILGDISSALAGVWMLTLFPSFALWSIGGLETPLYIFSILLAVGFFLKQKRLWLSSLLFLLPALTRHEGIVIYFIAFFLLLFKNITNLRNAGEKDKKNHKRILLQEMLSFTLPFVICYGIYYIWRWQYFGMFMPNTFYAKVKFSAYFLKNKLLKKASVLHYISPLMLLALGNFLSGKRDRKFRMMAFFTIITALLSILPYRDWMPGFRYVLPAIPLLIIMGSVSLVRIGKNKNLKFLGALVLMIIVSFYLLTGNVFLRGANKSICEPQKEVGLWLKGIAPEGSSLATFDLGAVSYYSEIPVIYDTHYEGILSTNTTQVGYTFDYFLDKKPTFFYFILSKEEKSYKGLNSIILRDDFQNSYKLLKKFPKDDKKEINIFGLRNEFPLK
jgi:hypothetical protein